MIFIKCYLTYALLIQNDRVSLGHGLSHPTTGSNKSCYFYLQTSQELSFLPQALLCLVLLPKELFTQLALLVDNSQMMPFQWDLHTTPFKVASFTPTLQRPSCFIFFDIIFSTQQVAPHLLVYCLSLQNVMWI